MGELPEDQGEGPRFPKVTWLMAFRVPGKPVAKNKKRRYLTDKEREYMDHVGWSFKAVRTTDFPIEGEVGMHIIFYRGVNKKTGLRSKGKWDIDNHAKPIQDGLNGLAYEDDQQITALSAEIRDCDHGQDHTVVWLGRKES